MNSTTILLRAADLCEKGWRLIFKRDTRINHRHRYLIKRNSDGAFVGSTNDLGLHLPAGHIHLDTRGEDNLGPGIRETLRSAALRARAAAEPQEGE